ncbi:MAG: signal peptide peptidase SppA, partial [Candidatus Latescibacteria bacterium]|nr:signal peptide peptidase SppA [Candidatus Latescibacterota bacterium]
TAYEIRQALERFIGVGKSLVVYAEEMDTREYYIASVADSIVMPRLGTLNLIGFSATVPFLKGTLDKLGITPEFARIGRYKSAMETLTDTTISAADREQLESLLDDWYEQIVDRIAQSRGMIPDSLTKLIDISPMLANDAVSVGLLDKIGYRSEAKDAIKEMVGAGDSIIPQKFVDVRRRRYHDDRWGSRPQIALIFASGTIVLGESSSDFFSGSQGMGAETIGKAIRRARKNDSVKAIVFRVDSPGGSALASDLIWQELHQAVEDGKPVIVSMGDVAASGGYYVACAADTILAPPGAVVGSIGVFSGKMVMTDLYSKLGINTVILKRGRNADVYSSQQSLTDEQWEMLRKGVRDVYDVFVDRVAEGRNMNAADVDSLGRGRFYSGESALKYGLVDQLGGLYDALDIALEMAELEDASLLVLPETPSFWDAVWQADASALLPAIWRLRGQSPLLIDPLAGSLGQ